MADDRATNVIEALRRVVEELPGIGKDERASQQQGGYAYRGIEAITSAAQPLLAKHGVVFVPEVIAWDRDPLVVNGKPWTDDRMQIRYTVYGPGGTEDRIVVGPIPAVGRDNSDKGANKCMTQAFKYALLQVLCISDPKDDTDGQTHEADSRPPAVRRNQGPMADPDGEPTSKGNTRRGPGVLPGWNDIESMRVAHDEYAAKANAAPEAVRVQMQGFKEAESLRGWPLPRADLDRLDDMLDTLLGAHAVHEDAGEGDGASRGAPPVTPPADTPDLSEFSDEVF